MAKGFDREAPECKHSSLFDFEFYPKGSNIPRAGRGTHSPVLRGRGMAGAHSHHYQDLVLSDEQ